MKSTEGANLLDPLNRPKAVVKLVRATRLPPRHSKLVWVDCRSEGSVATCKYLLPPELKTLKEYELAMSEAVVEMQKEMTMQITKYLNAGQVLSELEPAIVTEYGRDNFPKWTPTGDEP